MEADICEHYEPMREARLWPMRAVIVSLTGCGWAAAAGGAAAGGTLTEPSGAHTAAARAGPAAPGSPRRDHRSAPTTRHTAGTPARSPEERGGKGGANEFHFQPVLLTVFLHGSNVFYLMSLKGRTAPTYLFFVLRAYGLEFEVCLHLQMGTVLFTAIDHLKDWANTWLEKRWPPPH